MSASPALSDGTAASLAGLRDRGYRGALRWTVSIALVTAIHMSLLLVARHPLASEGDPVPEPIVMELAPTPPPEQVAATPLQPEPQAVMAPPSDPVPPDPVPPDPLPPAPQPSEAPVAPEQALPLPPLPPAPMPEAPLVLPPLARRAAAALVTPARPQPAPRPFLRRNESPPPPPIAKAPVQTAKETVDKAVPSSTPAAAPPASQTMMTWRSELLAHLARYKRFPVAAQRRGEQGVVVMNFILDRNGHLLSAVMIQGSGYADLDAEAEAWIRRAEPMPPLPPELNQARTELSVPLRFKLQ